MDRAPYLEGRVIGFAACLRDEKLDVGICHAGQGSQRQHRVLRRRSALGCCHSLEGLCKGKYGKRRHQPVDVGPVRRADGIVSGIWRGVRTLDSDQRPHVHPRASYLWTTRSGAKSTIATRLPRNPPASSSFAAATAPWGPLRAVCLPYSFVTTPEVRGLFLASASRGPTRFPEDHSLEVSVPLSDCALKYISTI